MGEDSGRRCRTLAVGRQVGLVDEGRELGVPCGIHLAIQANTRSLHGVAARRHGWEDLGPLVAALRALQQADARGAIVVIVTVWQELIHFRDVELYLAESQASKAQSQSSVNHAQQRNLLWLPDSARSLEWHRTCCGCELGSQLIEPFASPCMLGTQRHMIVV